MFDWISSQIPRNSIYSSITNKLVGAAAAIDDDSVFDHCKSILETIFKTILADVGVAYDPNQDLPQLCKLCLDGLPLLTKEERSTLKKLNGGLMTATFAIAEFRNQFGTISHGQDIESTRSWQNLRKYCVEVTDKLGGFFLQQHIDSQSPKTAARLDYDRYKEFNEWFDEINDPVMIGEYVYKPSDVLYKIDFDAYRAALVDFEDWQAGSSG